ncbi:MAG TPA: histone deacetylase [Vicinamibacterales bacterium]|nr:histone deacetylase [Vicinamibacterales bacterium]
MRGTLMPLTLISSERFIDHVTPVGHPERPERAEVFNRVAEAFRTDGGRVIEPRPATDEDLARVHTRAHIEALTATRGRATMIDEDTFTSPESEEVARLAAGAVITAVDQVLDGPPRSRALVLVRPPGHHAEADRAMGFCFYNSIAVGAAYARARGCARVAIVDYDVHHGNGTQWIFYEDPTVLFVSSHQYPFYPGTGAASETGRGAGTGFTLNVPLAAGATDAEIEAKYADQVMPALREFRPDLLMISAGFDAHELDPLGQLRMTTEGFRRLTLALYAEADALCDGRVVVVTEGGYDLGAVSQCLTALVESSTPS